MLWNMIESGYYTIMFLVASIFCFGLIYKIRNISDKQTSGFYESDYCREGEEVKYRLNLDGFMGCIFSCIFGVISLVCMSGQVLEIIKIYVVPKIWLIEYSARLIGK